MKLRGVLERAEPVGEHRRVLQRLEPGLGVRVVVGHPRPGVRPGDLQIGEQRRRRSCEVIEVPRSACTTCGMPWTRRTPRCIMSSASTADSRGVHAGADDVAGVDVDHHVGVVVDALDRARRVW